MDTARTLALAESLCILFEGVYLRPYLCPAGIPTIGVGSTRYEDGVAVTLADPPITRERAMQLLRWKLRNSFLPGTLALCPGIEDEAKLAAIVDFAYNLGTGNLRASTLRKRINAGQWDAVPAELRKWVNAGGKRLAGLVRRREAEIALL